MSGAMSSAPPMAPQGQQQLPPQVIQAIMAQMAQQRGGMPGGAPGGMPQMPMGGLGGGPGMMPGAAPSGQPMPQQPQAMAPGMPSGASPQGLTPPLQQPGGGQMPQPQNPNLAMFARAAQGQPSGGGAPPGNLRMNAAELAQMGRFGDSIIAHLTPGEIAVPPQIQTPKVLATLKHAMQHAGAQPNSFVAGSPQSSHNPMTGAPEYNLLSSILPAVLGTVGAVAAPFTAGASMLPAAALAAAGSAAGSGLGTALTGGSLGQSLISGATGAVGGLAGPAVGGVADAASGLGAGAAAADQGLAQAASGAANAGSGAASGAVSGAADAGASGASPAAIAAATQAGAMPGMVPPAQAAADRAATFGGSGLAGAGQGGSSPLAALAASQQGASAAPAAGATGNTTPLTSSTIPSGSMPASLPTSAATSTNPMGMQLGGNGIDWNDVGKAIKVAGALAPVAAAGIGALGAGGNKGPAPPPGFNTPLGPVNPNYNQILGNSNAPRPSFNGYNPIQTATQGPQYNFYQQR